MANRAFFSDNDGQFLEKRRTLYAVMDFGSSGAVTLKAWTPSQGGVAGSYSTAPSGGTQGIASVAKQATGKYLITLQDGYQRILGVRGSWQNALSTGTPVAPAAPIVALASDSTLPTASGGKTVQFATFGPLFTYNSGTPANSTVTNTPTSPASGERLYLEIVLDDSGVAGG